MDVMLTIALVEIVVVAGVVLAVLVSGLRNRD